MKKTLAAVAVIIAVACPAFAQEVPIYEWDELLQANRDNEVAAKQKYVGKPSVVRGPVINVQYIFGKPTILIGKGFSQVQAIMPKDIAGLENIKPGHIVRVSGNIRGFTLGSAFINGASFTVE